jgi:hypothetical protein
MTSIISSAPSDDTLENVASPPEDKTAPNPGAFDVWEVELAIQLRRQKHDHRQSSAGEAVAIAPSDDPVVPLFLRYCEIETELARILSDSADISDEEREVKETELSNTSVNVLSEFASTRPTTLDGVRLKLFLYLDQNHHEGTQILTTPQLKAADEYQYGGDHLIVAAYYDLVRLLEENRQTRQGFAGDMLSEVDPVLPLFDRWRQAHLKYHRLLKKHYPVELEIDFGGARREKIEETEHAASSEMYELEKQIVDQRAISIGGMKAKIAVAADFLRSSCTTYNEETGESRLDLNGIAEEIILSLERDAGNAPAWRFEETPTEYLAAVKTFRAKRPQ